MPHVVHAAGPFFAEAFRVAVLRRTAKEAAACGALALASIAAAFAASLFCEALFPATAVFRENGPIELVQMVVVGLAGLMFLVAALRLDYELFYGALALALGCLLAVIRETPGCTSHFYDGGVCLSETGNEVTRILAVAVVVGLAALRREPLARRLRDLNFFWAVPGGTAFAILVCAEIMEKSRFASLEETLELAGYLYLVVFAAALNLRPQWFDVRRKPPLAGAGIWSRG
ncbi:hypothetical protein [Jiella sonneratiae]|uniref:PrsW family intramembrane metalloprotease n=1 Tax=Jiella sonneratiae TaxID=2816856 RepID=A0ABS3J293_9HYPH|nr:hypothetical protein [Jiella sonneratiae]MBO0903777.1 hypothetical protein [Jiella sonneratiae]